MDYYSDLSYESSSEEEEEDHDAFPAWAFEHYIYEGICGMWNKRDPPCLQPDVMDEREIAYERIEAMLERQHMPAIIESIKNKCTGFDFREAAIGGPLCDIESVVPWKAVRSWNNFWEMKPEVQGEMWTYEEWSNLAEFSLDLLDCCDVETNAENVQACMINILSLCNFK